MKSRDEILAAHERDRPTSVILTGLEMPFGELVVLLVKVWLAALVASLVIVIPAAIIALLIGIGR
jgi:hypothetical protein